MSIYLVQHGKSLPKDVDPQQGLSQQGISDTTRIAGVAAGYSVHVGSIKHTGKPVHVRQHLSWPSTLRRADPL